MTTDCPELRSLLSAVGEKIDATQGKLDSQEIGNALYGLQALNSDMPESKCTMHTLLDFSSNRFILYTLFKFFE